MQSSIWAGIVSPPGTIPAQIAGVAGIASAAAAAGAAGARRISGTPSAPEHLQRAGGLRRTPGERFLDELSRHPFPALRPLPVEYRPMASVIVGERQPVRVSTSHASRRALARVGKRAATTGDTIHLDRPRPTSEVIAHELTHVAHPSPAPRFFADDHRGPEERHAERVAAVMRRSPILPGVRSLGSTPSVQRAPASDTVSAAALAASITRSQPEAASGPIQRAPVRRFTTPGTPLTSPTVAPPPDSSPAVTSSTPAQQATAPTTSETLAQFERILELLEDRIMSELERRGGRFRGGF